jgi:hypothetical protein
MFRNEQARTEMKGSKKPDPKDRGWLLAPLNLHSHD